MKPLRFLPVVVLLTACGAAELLPPPSTLASATTKDERAGLAVERVYQAAARLTIEADRAGLIPVSARQPIATADRQAYAAVAAVRSAYDAGNATSYAAAEKRARDAVVKLLKAMGR